MSTNQNKENVNANHDMDYNQQQEDDEMKDDKIVEVNSNNEKMLDELMDEMSGDWHKIRTETDMSDRQAGMIRDSFRKAAEIWSEKTAQKIEEVKKEAELRLPENELTVLEFLRKGELVDVQDVSQVLELGAVAISFEKDTGRKIANIREEIEIKLNFELQIASLNSELDQCKKQIEKKDKEVEELKKELAKQMKGESQRKPTTPTPSIHLQDTMKRLKREREKEGGLKVEKKMEHQQSESGREINEKESPPSERADNIVINWLKKLHKDGKVERETREKDESSDESSNSDGSDKSHGSKKSHKKTDQNFALYMRLNSLPDPEPYSGKSKEDVDEFLQLFEMKFKEVIQSPRELSVLLKAKFLKGRAKKLFDTVKVEDDWGWDKIKERFKKLVDASRTSRMAKAVDTWMCMTIRKDQSMSKYLIEVDKIATDAFDIPAKQLDLLKTQKLLQAARRNASMIGLMSMKRNDKKEGEQYEYLRAAAIQFEYDTKSRKNEYNRRESYKKHDEKDKSKNKDEKEEETDVEDKKENKPRAFACFNCGKRGHKAAECRAPKRVFQIEEEQSEENSMEEVLILKQPVKNLSQNAEEEERRRVKEMPPTQFGIYDVNRRKIEVIKIVEIPVKVRNMEAMVKFQIIKNEENIAIIGTDVFDKFGIFIGFRDDSTRVVRADQKCRIPPKSSKILQIKIEPEERDSDEFMFISRRECIPDGICNINRKNRSLVKIENINETPLLIKKNAIIGMAEFDVWNEVKIEEKEVTERTVNRINVKENNEEIQNNERYENVIKVIESNGKLQEEATEIIKEFIDIFALEDSELTQTDVGEYEIEVESDKPVRQKPRPIPIAMQNKVAKMIAQMLKNDVIRESKSGYSSPVVLVKKKNGKLRMCVDYRKLNAVIKTNAFPLPHIEMTLQSLNEKSTFSTVDMLAGYWQIRLEEKSKEKTAFAVLGKLFEFNVLPFGLATSPAIFQSIMETMLGELLNNCAYIYIDDLLIASKNEEEHKEDLRKVLEKVQAAGLKLKAEKCQFFREEVEYLGHVLTRDGVKADKKKIEKVQEWPTPKNKEQLQSFLGFCNYYRRYVFNFAQIVAPLTPLTSPKVAWIWQNPQEEAFKKLKKIMTEAPVLAQPDINAAQTLEKPFAIFTDASSYGTGAVLAQLSSNGCYKPIAFASKSLTSAERRYHITDQEALALVMALRRFKHFVYGLPITVFTDHQPLTSLFKSTKLANRLLRWSLELQDYQLTIIYVKGKANIVADALSRGAVKEPEEMMESREKEVELMKIINQVQRSDEVDEENWRKLLEKEDLWRNLIEKLETGTIETRAKIPGRKPKIDISDFTMVNGQLYKIAEKDEKLVRVVPIEKTRKLFENAHCSALIGHSSGERTKKRLQKDYYWPKMGVDVEKWYKECKECLWGNAQEKLVAPLKPYVTSRPMEIVATDLIEMGVSERGNKYILSVIDLFSKYATAVAIPNKKAETVTEALIESWIIREGRIPKILLSDQGLEFCNETMTKLMKMTGTEQIQTKGYNSRENGAVERFNRTIVTMLKKDLNIPADWDKKLPFSVFAYNSTPHETTGESPHFLLYGFDPKIPLETAPEDEIRLHHMDTQEYKYLLAQELHEAHEAVRQKARKEQEKYKKEFDRKTGANEREYPQKGDRVLIKIPTEKGHATHPKLTNEWKGPYRVVECSQNSVEVIPVIGKSEKIRIPYDQVKKVPIEFVDMPIETKKRRGRKKSAKNIVQNISQKSQYQDYFSRSPTCGCGNCKINMRWQNGSVQTNSITVCAGIHLANRLKLQLSDSQLLLWAQGASITTEDQVEAIFSFARCSRILEYLEEFESWKIAVENARFEVNGHAKPQPTEIYSKIVVIAPKFERAKIMVVKEVSVVYIDDDEIPTFFQRFHISQCKKIIFWMSTKNEPEYGEMVKKMLESRPKKMEIVVLPLPLSGLIEQLPEIVKIYKALGGFSNVTIVSPSQLLAKNGLSMTAQVDGGKRVKHEDLFKYMGNIKKAIPKHVDWLQD